MEIASLLPRRDHAAFEVLAIVLIFVVMPLFSSLPLSAEATIFALAICLLSFIALSAGHKLTQTGLMQPPHWLFAAYLTWLLILLALFPGLTALSRVIQMFGCLVAFSFGLSTSISKVASRCVQRCIEAVLLACLVIWLVEGMPLAGFSGFSINPNSFASIIFCWFVLLFFDGTSSTESALFKCLCFFLVLVSSSRTVLAALLLFLAAKTILDHSKNSRHFTRRCRVLFVVFLLAMIGFVAAYAQINATPLGQQLNEFSQQVFHKDFFSGRQKMWGQLILLIQDQPFTGYGLDAVPSSFLPLSWSSHNLFLQTALQCGIPGLLLLCLILISIFFQASQKPITKKQIVSLAFLFALTFHESFEICLTQNALYCGTMMWCLLGFGCQKKSALNLTPLNERNAQI